MVKLLSLLFIYLFIYLFTYLFILFYFIYLFIYGFFKDSIICCVCMLPSDGTISEYSTGKDMEGSACDLF
jgi:hypothetical protein